MKTLIQILFFILMINSSSLGCQDIDLGILGASTFADKIIEVEITNITDSSDWKLYPNGFKYCKMYRILIDCKIIQSSQNELTDLVRLCFNIGSSDSYDSLGVFLESECEYIVYSGLEFKMEIGEKYVFIIKNGVLLRAEKMDYKTVYREFLIAKRIDKYLIENYNRNLYIETLKNGIFYKVTQIKNFEDIESILYYNPLIKKFTLLMTDSFFESEVIEFDLDSKSVVMEDDYYKVLAKGKIYKLNKINLTRIEEVPKVKQVE